MISKDNNILKKEINIFYYYVNQIPMIEPIDMNMSSSKQLDIINNIKEKINVGDISIPPDIKNKINDEIQVKPILHFVPLKHDILGSKEVEIKRQKKN